jgi:hypothetical protein
MGVASDICFMQANSDAVNKICALVAANLSMMCGLNKSRVDFLSTVYEHWFGLPVRYTILNLSRFSGYAEKTIRLQFEKVFDFFAFNRQTILKHCGTTKILAIDQSYISKSGHSTHGTGKFWSGCAGEVLPGLEITVLAIIDVVAGTAMHLEAVQTPGAKTKQSTETLITHYVNIIINNIVSIKELANYLVADGYFMKDNFIAPLVKAGLHIITKMRTDANLRYLYSGERAAKRGRPKKYGDKVGCKNIDKSRFIKFDEDKRAVYYSGKAYCMALKRIVKIVYIENIISKEHAILMSTDCEQDGAQILQYYRLRFQIEFLIRDAKQYCGLEQCQARSTHKLNFHFNIALSVVSVAKAATWLSLSKEHRGPFSMRNIKLLFSNKILAERIISTLKMNPNHQKIQDIYPQCLDIATLAA